MRIMLFRSLCIFVVFRCVGIKFFGLRLDHFTHNVGKKLFVSLKSSGKHAWFWSLREKEILRDLIIYFPTNTKVYIKRKLVKKVKQKYT